MGRCRLRLRWNPRGGQDGCGTPDARQRTEAGRDERGFRRGGRFGVLPRLPEGPLMPGKLAVGRGGLGLTAARHHLGSTRGLPRRGRIRLLPGFSAPSRALHAAGRMPESPRRPAPAQCVHAVLVRTGRGVSAGPGEDKGDRQPFPCGVPLMPRLVSLDPARRRSAPDTGIRGRSVWRCGCSCPPTRPKQHLHGRRWRSWR